MLTRLPKNTAVTRFGESDSDSEAATWAKNDQKRELERPAKPQPTGQVSVLGRVFGKPRQAPAVQSRE